MGAGRGRLEPRWRSQCNCCRIWDTPRQLRPSRRRVQSRGHLVPRSYYWMCLAAFLSCNFEPLPAANPPALVQPVGVASGGEDRLKWWIGVRFSLIDFVNRVPTS